MTITSGNAGLNSVRNVWTSVMVSMLLIINQANYPIMAVLYSERGAGASPELIVATIIFVVALPLLLLNSRFSRDIIIPVVILVFCIVWVSVSNYISQSGFRSFLTFPSFLLYMLFGYCIVSSHKHFLKFLPAVFLAICIGWDLFLLVNILVGNFQEIYAGGMWRLVWPGKFSGTEIPMFLGVQFCYLLFCFSVIKNNFARLFIIALLMVNAYFMLMSGARSAIGAYVVITLFYVFMSTNGIKKKLQKVIFIIFAVCILLAILGEDAVKSLLFSMSERITNDDDTGGGGRVLLYSAVINVIGEHPYFGIGIENWRVFGLYAGVVDYVHGGIKEAPPHQNILGISALAGIPVAVAYVLLFGLIIYRGFIKSRVPVFTRDQYVLKMLIIMALSIVIYQQFRGLIQDTWTFKETYLWSGVILGAITRNGVATMLPYSRDRD